MAQPTQSDVHVNAPLTNVAVNAFNNDKNFVYDRVFPMVASEGKTGNYLTIDKADMSRDDAVLRAPGTAARRSGIDMNFTSTYSCERYDLAASIPDDVRRNQTNPADVERIKTQMLVHKLKIRQERIFATNFFAASKWGTDLTPSTLWDVATSDPIGDIQTAHETILKATGDEPNKLVLGIEVYNHLKKHPLIIERVKYGVRSPSFDLSVAPRAAASQALADLFEVDEVLVCKASYESAVEGETSSRSWICGDHALLVHAQPAASLDNLSGGYNIAWSGFGGNEFGIRMKKYRDEAIESDIVEAAFCVDMKLVDSARGYFFSQAIS